MTDVRGEIGVEDPDTESASPVYVHLTVADPEVIAAIGEYPVGAARNEFVQTCLKIGVLSLRAARGTVDGAALKATGDHLIDQLTERLTGYRQLMEEGVSNTLAKYFDPANGLFPSRVESLVRDDGELTRLIHTQVATAHTGMHQTLEKFLGENSAFLELMEPTDSNRLIAAMRQSCDSIMSGQRVAILEQFSLDEPNSALSRLVRELTASHGNLVSAISNRVDDVVKEFSLDSPESALSRLVARVELAQQSMTSEFSLDNDDSSLTRLRREMDGHLKTMTEAQSSFHTQVVGMLSALDARKKAEARSTTHGATFEEAVGDRLAALASRAGDIVDSCGATTGVIRASRVGDFVITLPPDSVAAGANIVVEAKEAGNYTLKSTLEEADMARRNRSAAVCLFVHSARSAPQGLEPLSKYGNDVVVVWDSENESSDVVLQAGYLTAKALSVRTAQRSLKDKENFIRIDKAIEIIRKQMGGFNELKTTGETMQNGAAKMLDRVRIMHGELERQIETIADQLAGVREDSETGEAG